MLKSLEYMEKNKQVGYFGIKYLDDKLRGILNNDLILIGARSGAGKSTVSQMIAAHNSKLGKRVGLFSLENFEGDDFMQKCFYLYRIESRNYDLHQRDFVSGRFDIDLEALKRAELKTDEYFKNVYIVPRKKDFNIVKLKDEMIKSVQNGCKILIIDHLDYIDKENGESNDVSHITEIMRKIRELQNEFHVAVIAISHLRKPSSVKDAPAVPSMDEFIGSSNKVKESTAVVMLAPDDKANEDNAGGALRSTWCCVRKLRMGGFDNTAGKLSFNVRSGEYQPEYKVYSVNYSGTEQHEI